MARPARRLTLTHLALLAWLVWIAFAVVASALPFFFEIRLWAPSGKGYWGCKHGSIYHARVHRPTVSTVRGDNLSLAKWNPGTAASIDFEWGPTSNVEPKPDRFSRPFVRRAPPWAVLLMPTLLVILLARPARFIARRLPGWLAVGLARLRDPHSAERRALLAAGRVPCPKCDYDITGLERCPECGTPSRAVRLKRFRPATIWRLALVAWLGLAGAAALMPFLFEMYWDFGLISIGTSDGCFEIGYVRSHRYWANYKPPNVVDWKPGLLRMFDFDARWAHTFRYVQFPPWLVVLVPTLIAMIIRREIRYYKRRRIKKLGRTLCPACQYDATGLEVCPECGVAITTTRPKTEPQA